MIRPHSKTGLLVIASACAVVAQAARLDPVIPIELPPGVAVFFNPQDDIKAKLRVLLTHARTEILVNEYAITDPDIAADLVDAFKKRHVFVAIILESRPAVPNYATPQYFLVNDLPVLVYKGPGCNNQKYIILDRETVLTGSYDLTKAAASTNQENLIAVTDAGVAVAYYNNWCRFARLCEPPTPSSQ